MRKSILFLWFGASVLAAHLGGLTHTEAQERCLVTNPIGGPLEVSLAPNGRIIGVVPNGTLVKVIDRSTQKGKDWVYVELIATQIRLGWVFREFLNCDHGLKDAQQAANREQPIDGYAFDYRDESSETVSGLEECISSCQAAAGCRAYVFFKSKKFCRLMTRSDATLVPNSDAVSGYRTPAVNLP